MLEILLGLQEWRDAKLSINFLDNIARRKQSVDDSLKPLFEYLMPASFEKIMKMSRGNRVNLYHEHSESILICPR